MLSYDNAKKCVFELRRHYMRCNKAQFRHQTSVTKKNTKNKNQKKKKQNKTNKQTKNNKQRNNTKT